MNHINTYDMTYKDYIALIIFRTVSKQPPLSCKYWETMYYQHENIFLTRIVNQFRFLEMENFSTLYACLKFKHIGNEYENIFVTKI